jgi:RHS repeat-associated protein
LLTMNYPGVSESRGYNVLNQLTTLNNGTENLTYTYPTGTNNGKISSMYDSLNRLLTANGSTGWGQQYGFDGFGNLLSKTVTAGTGPSLSVSVNPANNQIQGVSGLTYDANGNQSQSVGAYDAENRLVGGVGIYYGYDSQNKRIWSWAGGVDSNGNTTNYTVNVYSPGGQKLGAYVFATVFVNNSQTMYVTVPSLNVTGGGDVYFGGRRLAAMDQLGSVGNYFPWGEDKGGTSPQNTWNFATYWRDSVSGLDYANNRYYSNAYGRFMTPDPYQATATSPGDPKNPQSWNRYAYVQNDPLNYIDPSGLLRSAASGPLPQDGEGGGGPPPSGCSVNGEWTSPCPGVPSGGSPSPQPNKPGPGQRTCPAGLYLDAFGHCVTQVQCFQSANQQLANQKQLAQNAFVQGFGTSVASTEIAAGLLGCAAGAFFGGTIGMIGSELLTGTPYGAAASVPTCLGGAADAVLVTLPLTSLIAAVTNAAQYFTFANAAEQQFQQNIQNCLQSF